MTQMKSQKVRLIAAGCLLAILLALATSLTSSAGTAQVRTVGDPIAAAYVRADGTIAKGTSNVSTAFFDAVTGQYEITLSGEDYYYQDYVSLVTLSDNDPLIISTSSVNGHLVVVVIDLQGRPVQADFQFVTFKL